MIKDYFYSVEDVWVVWILSLGGLSLMTYRAVRSRHWRSLGGFLRDERGASYALPYMMTFPLYMIFVCWTIQSTMILIVKIGVMHSAHMAARSAIVWRSADPNSDSQGLQLAEEHAQQSAVLAMVPYASGLRGHQPLSFSGLIDSYKYERLYAQLAQGSEASQAQADSAYVRRKFMYASAKTDIEIKPHSNRFNEPLSVEVSFEMPIHIPGTGMLLGTRNWLSNGYYRDIKAKATLPLETPESIDGRLGIQYDPTQL